VANAASGHRAFDLGLANVGSFGGHSARVVWVGTTTGLTELCDLAADIENELENAGWPRESREFSGHLTLCRVKNFIVGKKLYQAALKLADFDAGVTHIDAVHVYQSRLSSKGSEYTKISTTMLE
jgi:2'-5' RNA ligase